MATQPFNNDTTNSDEKRYNTMLIDCCY